MRTNLSATDLYVSKLALGTNVFGNSVKDINTAKEILDYYIDNGGNFIDTADMYGDTKSESMIGEWIKTQKRSDIIIATKVGKGNYSKLDYKNIFQAVKESLKRLNTDYIDIYYAHYDDLNTPLEETVAAFDKLIKDGYIRYAGASNYSGKRLQLALDIAKNNNLHKYVVLQPEYNMIDRAGYEEELMGICDKEFISCIPYYGIARGFFTEKYLTKNRDVDTYRLEAVQKHYFSDNNFKLLNLLKDIASEYSTSIASIAISWVLNRTAVKSAIASARNIKQLSQLLEINSVYLTNEHMEAINKLSDICAYKKTN